MAVRQNAPATLPSSVDNRPRTQRHHEVRPGGFGCDDIIRRCPRQGILAVVTVESSSTLRSLRGAKSRGVLPLLIRYEDWNAC